MKYKALTDIKEDVLYTAPPCGWWTHDPLDLYHMPDGKPCGPNGEDIITILKDVFFQNMMERLTNIGYTEQVLLAAHAQNCMGATFETWNEYEEYLYELLGYETARAALEIIKRLAPECLRGEIEILENYIRIDEPCKLVIMEEPIGRMN